MVHGSRLMVEADGKQAEAHDPENCSSDVGRYECGTGRESSSETCICIRGHFEEYFYDENGNLTDTIDMVSGGTVLNIEAGQWHSLKCLESGTILLEAKDGAYHPLDEDEIWKENKD